MLSQLCTDHGFNVFSRRAAFSCWGALSDKFRFGHRRGVSDFLLCFLDPVIPNLLIGISTDSSRKTRILNSPDLVSRSTRVFH